MTWMLVVGLKYIMKKARFHKKQSGKVSDELSVLLLPIPPNLAATGTMPSSALYTLCSASTRHL